MREFAGHTIHRDHIHHGWNNAFQPCLRIAPGESVQFETIDASSGQLSKTSTAADLEKLDLGRVNPVTGPVWIDGAMPGDALKVTVLSLRVTNADGYLTDSDGAAGLRRLLAAVVGKGSAGARTRRRRSWSRRSRTTTSSGGGTPNGCSSRAATRPCCRHCTR